MSPLLGLLLYTQNVTMRTISLSLATLAKHFTLTVFLASEACCASTASQSC